MRAFGVWGTREVFVVDPDGVIRYPDTSLDNLARRLMTLVPTRDTAAGMGAAAASTLS